MKYKLWLMILNISNISKIKLIKEYKDEEEIYKKITSIYSKSNYLKGKLTNASKEEILEKAKILEAWNKKNNVMFITINDKEYPEELKLIDEPPYGLFYKGNIKCLNNKKVAFVGSRNCTNYGIEVTKILTKELISYSITIISGGARGIDSIAHNIAVNEDGSTVIVLGCGIDIVYPSSNVSLYKKVIEKGLILTEFLPKTPPMGYNFPRRNRLISGLSQVVLIIEAAKKSGSLITASYALEQGKDVMAIPGSIFSKESEGCNAIIADGAYPYSSFNDLCTLLKLNKKKNILKKSPLKDRILNIIESEPKHIDYIAVKSLIDRDTLFNVLFEMQIGNEIVSLPGNYYAKII